MSDFLWNHDIFTEKNRRPENLAIFRDVNDFSAMFSTMIFTSKTNGGTTSRPLSGCVPNLAKTHFYKDGKTHKATSSRASTLDVKTNVATLSCYCFWKCLSSKKGSMKKLSHLPYLSSRICQKLPSCGTPVWMPQKQSYVLAKCTVYMNCTLSSESSITKQFLEFLLDVFFP